jgi:putative tryptophan/tyrosine transport system substrate-binding protein
MPGMRRREFVSLLGGAAAWPLAARAQQPERMPRIGVLSNLTEDDPEARARDAAFVQGLRQLDWIAGRNVQIEYRYAAADPARFRSFAAELAGLGPNVVLAYTSPAVAALQQAMPSVPIVFASVIDPVGAGIVETLARPGGNATGFTVFEYGIAGKWLELLKEIAPEVTRAAIIRDPAIPAGIGQFAAIQSVAPSLGIEFSAIGVRDPAEIERGVATFSRSANGGLIVTASVLATAHRRLIIEIAARYRLPALYPFRYYVTGDGLMSYGPDQVDQFRRAAAYVDRILKGEKPADLPVQAPTKYELVINLKTARALGLSVPPTLLARADEVIE